MEKTEATLFSERLRIAIERSGYGSDSPIQLKNAHNTFSKNDPISVVTARNWLSGASIPKQSRLIVLSNWLGVSASWLRFGVDDVQKCSRPEIDTRDIRKDFSDSIRCLDDENLAVVSTLITVVGRLQNNDYFGLADREVVPRSRNALERQRRSAPTMHIISTVSS